MWRFAYALAGACFVLGMLVFGRTGGIGDLTGFAFLVGFLVYLGKRLEG